MNQTKLKRPCKRKSIEEPVELENKIPLTAGVESIEKYTDTLKSLLPTRDSSLHWRIPDKHSFKRHLCNQRRKRGFCPFLWRNQQSDVIKWSQGKLESSNIVCLDEDVDTHFWYDILPSIAKNERFYERIKNKHMKKLQRRHHCRIHMERPWQRSIADFNFSI